MQQTLSLSDLSVERFMTLASSSLSSLSSLSAASSSYLETVVVPSLPGPLQAAAQRFATAVAYNNNNPSSILASPTTAVVVSFLTILLTIAVAMSSWRNPLGLWRRTSPYGKPSSSQPQVSDSDYSYLTANDIDERQQQQPQHAYDPVYVPRQSPRMNDSDDLAPDIITLKHRGVTYPLHFPAYAIGDGLVTIGDIRLKTARATDADDLRRVKLLYKGRLLKDDSKRAKDVGIKQESELMCVVSEVAESDSESEVSDLNQPIAPDKSPKPKKPRGKKGKNKGKGKKKNRTDSSAESSPNLAPPPTTASPNLAPPVSATRPSASAPPSPTPSIPPSPSLQPFKTAREKIDALKNYWRTMLVPPIENYIASPPADPKIRDFEHKMFSETTMAQVILKADGIEPDGDETARSNRKALIVEIQQLTKRLDEASKT